MWMMRVRIQAEKFLKGGDTNLSRIPLDNVMAITAKATIAVAWVTCISQWEQFSDVTQHSPNAYDRYCAVQQSRLLQMKRTILRICFIASYLIGCLMSESN